MYIARSYWPYVGGSSTVTIELARGLSSRGNEVNLYLPSLGYGQMVSRSESMRPSGVDVNYQGPRLSKFLSETVSYVLLLRKVIPAAFHGQVILSHHHPTRLAVFCGAIASTVSGRPLVVRADDIVAEHPKNAKEKIITLVFRLCFYWSFKRARRVLVNGDDLVELMRRMYRLEADVVGVSPNGVDTRRFSPKRRSEILRRGLGSKHLVVFSGALYPVRGLDVLLSAVPYVKKAFVDLKVLVLGDGPDMGRLVKITKLLHLTRSVHFLGTVNPDLIPDYLASAEVGIGPLRASRITIGTYPMKVLEYMASGCVVLTVRDAVSRRLIVDSQTGFAAESSDSKELARMLVTALSHKEKSKRIARRARSLVERTYNWDRVVASLDAVLRSEVKKYAQNADQSGSGT